MKHIFAIAVLLTAACSWAVGDAANDERELAQLVNDLRDPGTVPGGSQERERGFRLAGAS